VNVWLVGAAVLAVALVPAAIASLRGRATDRLVGMELMAILLAQLLVLDAVGERRVAFVDVGLAVAMLGFGGGLVFARFLERWL
jgi:multicomponent Na+:H+ antiporter subunit F